MKKIYNLVIVILALLPVSLVVKGQPPKSVDFGTWPAGCSPMEIGARIALKFLATPHTNFNRPTPPRVITYPESCAWYGALTFAKVTGNKKLTGLLMDRFSPLLGSRDSLIPVPDHVDYTVFGAVPLALYTQTKNPALLKLGKDFADKQWGPPVGKRVTADSRRFYAKGLSWQTRLWIDDMYMLTLVQAEATRATGDYRYIEKAANEMVFYLDSLQRPGGLFYHAADVPYFWGRGNGWMAAGMSELLLTLPADNSNRSKIMAGYKKMMAKLLSYQSPDGMWRQLLDDPDSWEESSGTGMFTFAFITGVREGWLDKETYGPAAKKAWLALVSHIGSDDNITDVCEGTNKKNDHQYYLNRKRITGDLHGQAPILWCAAALLRRPKNSVASY